MFILSPQGDEGTPFVTVQDRNVGFRKHTVVQAVLVR